MVSRFKSITFNAVLDKIKANKELSGGKQGQLIEFNQQLEEMAAQDIKTLFSAVYMSINSNSAKGKIINAAKSFKE